MQESIVYSDKTPSFTKFLEPDRSVPIHILPMQILATEIFKVSRDLAPTIFSEIFLTQSVQYNLRQPSEVSVPNAFLFFLLLLLLLLTLYLKLENFT